MKVLFYACLAVASLFLTVGISTPAFAHSATATAASRPEAKAKNYSEAHRHCSSYGGYRTISEDCEKKGSTWVCVLEYRCNN